ncbi:MAG: carboxypeptidase-like regulatory domain-containing protein [Ignavibacteriaceae bacterium]|nr:carboxypeptidase-like regulatory domain-containing protein [Ignavibacteriaceae bacterium]
MKNFTIRIFSILLLLIIVSPGFAQTGVGKLSGKVVDAGTREALIGANIVIMNTDQGAATNVDGEYFVLNITPGTYDVRVSYVGYAPKTIKEVRIVAGITYELNVELSTDFTLPEIVVQDKKFFEEKATNTVKVIDSDQISRIPVKGVQNIASLQSGVVIQEGSGGVEGNATINIRGGRGSEVLYIVDGVPQNNLYNRGTVTQVSNAAIEQISFQVGGYEAKYGQAQSGIINVTTKSGKPNYNILADVVASSLTETFPDKYGFNEYSATISGPIIPDIPEHTIFLSAERGWYKDADRSAIDLVFPSINKKYDVLPNNAASVWRFSGKTNHRLGDFTLNFGGIYNSRLAKVFDFRLVKNSSKFFDEFTEENLSLSTKISQTVSGSTYWNLNLGYRAFDYERYNPFFKQDLYAYGDSARWANELGVTLLGNGQRTRTTDEFGVFRPYGYSTGLYQHRENDAYTADFDFTSQVENHLLELGGGLAYTLVRGYGIYPQLLISQSSSLTEEQKFANLTPFVYGYDVTGKNKIGLDYTSEDPNFPYLLQRPRNPLIAYAYIQDRFELEDIVINAGIRMDYFDVKSYQFKNPSLPFAGGLNPNGWDNEDFELKKAELKFSPRLGLGFPVTQSTVFHAQYGKFIQLPELNDMYAGPYDYEDWLSFEPQGSQNGGLNSEETTQYEVGFRQVLGSTAALNITLFYKNIRGLVNDANAQWRRTDGGQILNAYYSQNTDFGTTKGLAFSFDISRLNYLSLSAQYTYSVAEGTGSSTSSSATAVFRNNDRLAPKVIAPLNFDQRHTAVINVDFFVPQGELGFLELFNANFLFSYNSGRPYTPMDKWNLIGDNGIISQTKGYVNSQYGPSSFRVDLKIEKSFMFENFRISPYVWVENLFDADNIVAVYRSTGSPYTTGWLNTEEGKAIIANVGEGYAQDYQSYERNPANFGIPRTIRLGLKINFSTLPL